jgi:nicotinate-nucleotide pyrophosphorylase (carboxylating)
MIFHYIDPNLTIDTFIADGMPVKYGDVCHVSGSSKSILKAERMVLNSMQRMSAIATKTNSFVKLLEGTNTKILHPKTTPGSESGQRSGGENHRFVLYDMIML